MENKIKLFEDRRIRYAWDAEREEWFFSITDVVKALTDSADEKQYLKKMKMRDPFLESNLGTICTLVQMVGLDGKDVYEDNRVQGGKGAHQNPSRMESN